MQKNKSTNCQKGFTLMELLVVIAVIALLMGILMPALRRAKAQAGKVVCMANLKQLNTANATYASQNDDSPVPCANMVSSGNEAYNRQWFHTMSKYIGTANYKDRAEVTEEITAVDAKDKFFLCPQAKKVTEVEVNDWGAIVGTNKNAWSYHGGKSSYGMNGWLWGGEAGKRMYYSWNGTDQGWPWLYDKMAQTSAKTPTFFDCVFTSSYVHGAEVIGTNINNGVPDYDKAWNLESGGLGTGLQRVCIDRHTMAINMAFADGHGENIKLDDLFMVKWNKKSKHHSDFNPKKTFVLP